MDHSDITPETLERWLNQCSTWVRAYLYPTVESLNVSKPGFDLGAERQDDLSEPFQESLFRVKKLKSMERISGEGRRDRGWISLEGRSTGR